MLAKDRILPWDTDSLSTSSGQKVQMLPLLLLINVRSPSSLIRPTLMEVTLLLSTLMYSVPMLFFRQCSSTREPMTSSPTQLTSLTLWPSRVMTVASFKASPPTVSTICFTE